MCALRLFASQFFNLLNFFPYPPRYHNRTLLLAPLVKNLLTALGTRDVTPELFAQLVPMKNSLSQFEIETTLMRDTLRQLIMSDEDMLSMLLTQKHESGGEPLPLENHTEVELIVENYLSQLIDISQEAYYLRKRVEGTQSIIQLKLDTYRNSLVQFNLQLSVGSLSIGFGTLLSGFFGANLINGLEQSEIAFACLGAGSVVGMLLIYNSLMRAFNRRRGTLRNSEEFSIFNHLEEIQKTLSYVRKANVEGGKLSRGKLQELLRERTGLELQQRDLEVLFSTFDRDKDGYLTFSEVSDRETLISDRRTITRPLSVLEK